jgi:hypothetical protein
MDARQAQTLQQNALSALGELRSWLGSRQATLAPVPAEQTSYAAYAAWCAQVDAALRAITQAFPECERRANLSSPPVEPEADSIPPTLPSRGAARSGWLPAPATDAPAHASVPPSSGSC